MGKKKSKRKAGGSGQVPPPRPKRAAWWVWLIVGVAVVGWLAVLAAWFFKGTPVAPA